MRDATVTNTQPFEDRWKAARLHELHAEAGRLDAYIEATRLPRLTAAEAAAVGVACITLSETTAPAQADFHHTQQLGLRITGR
jgi:hypothetical protein